MKIIREGSIEPETVRFNCTKCGCIFDAVKDLEARRIFDQREGDYYQCDCPTCHKQCTRQA